MNEKTKERLEKIAEIRKRLEEYNKHKNDPYAYYPEEIPQVRALLNNAPEDIKFLLSEFDRLDLEIKRLETRLENWKVD